MDETKEVNDVLFLSRDKGEYLEQKLNYRSSVYYGGYQRMYDAEFWFKPTGRRINPVNLVHFGGENLVMHVDNEVLNIRPNYAILEFYLKAVSIARENQASYIQVKPPNVRGKDVNNNSYGRIDQVSQMLTLYLGSVENLNNNST